MSRLTIPVTGKLLAATGDVRLWADVEIDLKDGSGQFHRRRFRVDTATDVTTFPAYEARQLGLPLPMNPSASASHAQTGLAVRSGFLRFRIPGMDPDEYAIGCLFLGDPGIPPDPSRPATLPRKLLQPLQLLDRLRFVLDRDPALGHLYGELVIEKR
jgi:hypothetical protein